MRIEKITNQIRNDIYGVLRCDCGGEQKFVGYDDANYHRNVVPTIKCKVCGRTERDATAK